jgi:hypothetical protein
MPAGIVNTKIAMMLAAIRATIAAMWALTLPLAIKTSNVTTGIAAAMVESVVLPNGL